MTAHDEDPREFLGLQSGQLMLELPSKDHAISILR
jgi:hypothetical protein